MVPHPEAYQVCPAARPQVDPPRQLQGLPSGCTAACPEMIEAYAAAIRAQALEDPTEAMKAVHQQMCLHQDWASRLHQTK